MTELPNDVYPLILSQCDSLTKVMCALSCRLFNKIVSEYKDWDCNLRCESLTIGRKPCYKYCVIILATVDGHLDIVKWCIATGSKWNRFTQELAQYNKRKDIIEWVKSQGLTKDRLRVRGKTLPMDSNADSIIFINPNSYYYILVNKDWQLRTTFETYIVRTFTLSEATRKLYPKNSLVVMLSGNTHPFDVDSLIESGKGVSLNTKRLDKVLKTANRKGWSHCTAVPVYEEWERDELMLEYMS